jgi:hypothetical protein
MKLEATDIEIYYHVLGDVELLQKKMSPLPFSNGRSRSLVLFESDDILDDEGYPLILWIDFRVMQRPARARTLLELTFGLSTEEAIAYANGEIAGKDVHIKRPDKAEAKHFYVEYYDDYQAEHLLYYHRIGITKEELVKNRIRPVRRAVFSEYNVWYSIPKKPLFAWDMGDSGLKVYNPLTSEPATKWRSLNVPKEELDGWEQLEMRDSNIIIPTSARKDRILSSKFVPSLNPHGTESELVPWEHNKERLLSAADWILFAYDGDRGGIYNSKKIVSQLDDPRIQWFDTRPYYHRLGRVQVSGGKRFLKDTPEIAEYFGLQAVSEFYKQMLDDFARWADQFK